MILVIAPSSCGKTAIAQNLSEMMFNLPCLSASEWLKNQPGYEAIDNMYGTQSFERLNQLTLMTRNLLTEDITKSCSSLEDLIEAYEKVHKASPQVIEGVRNPIDMIYFLCKYKKLTIVRICDQHNWTDFERQGIKAIDTIIEFLKPFNCIRLINVEISNLSCFKQQKQAKTLAANLKELLISSTDNVNHYFLAEFYVK